MRYAWYSYWPVKAQTTFQQVKAALPEPIRHELMSGSVGADHGIWIDAAKIDVIERLDQVVAGYGRHAIHKSLHVEVDRSERTAFDYYWIEPRLLDWGKQVHFEMTQPVCQEVHACRWDVRIVHPVRVSRRVLGSLLFGRITMAYEMAVHLVVSADLRRLFEAEDLRGLEYFPCVVQDGPGQQLPTGDCFVARVTHQIAEDATWVLPGEGYCPTHSTVLAPTVFDSSIRREVLAGMDFGAVQSVTTGMERYDYDLPWWLVSRKALDVLLDHKVRGLRPVTLRLREVFKPVLMR